MITVHGGQLAASPPVYPTLVLGQAVSTLMCGQPCSLVLQRCSLFSSLSDWFVMGMGSDCLG